ncbi:hypothetical protein AMS68_005937 [Peltaster fructicola]|uniref:DNA/RNA-binding domain-containing protein n=1 Tax=Peltaster fructicola TaxID=286661 RepID=A0A6H0Y194_9PEZI|nr:hypothetical protein AMS68_005937 [Peltaster fructicola]
MCDQLPASHKALAISKEKPPDASIQRPHCQSSSDQSSSLDSASPSSSSDGEGDTYMSGTAREPRNVFLPDEAAIDALSLSQREDRLDKSTPSSSSSGIKRRAEANLEQSTAREPSGLSYVATHEQPPSRQAHRATHAKKHSGAPAPKRHAGPRSSGEFVASKFTNSQRIDSAFVNPSRQTTFRSQSSWPTNVAPPPAASLLMEDVPGFSSVPINQVFGQPRTSRLLRQPETSMITQEQLAAEVKGIYAGLVMVEAKSINIDAQQQADPNSKLSAEQWQSLIALRRTLLYEHHDFLMATQHPSASPGLRNLAAKYCMPARMWKHGIHGFLEVLRHRRPESQEYMLTFIYLAYNMMALLFETVPAFTDTWIECLGDLARYRMAIEEDKEIHAIWGGVAARWYTLAADRHPQIGRLYHHLGILERPSLRKFYFYSRSLTSVVPFINARESLGTLCAPILQDDAAIRHGAHSAEAMTICYHARVFSNQDQAIIERDGDKALALLKTQTPGKIASYATPLAVTNIASLFEFGQPNNIFKQLFASALARAAHNARPSVLSTPAMSEAAKAISDSETFAMTTYPSDYTIKFFATCFNSLIRQKLDHGTVRDLLQYVHVNLVWINSLLDLRAGLSLAPHKAIVDKVLTSIDWAGLEVFLNELASIDPITTRVVEHATYNTFLPAENWRERKPLAEDFMIRGIIWAEGYLPIELFEGLEDDDGSRGLETPARLHLRAERVEWVACCIALPSKQSQLTFDDQSRLYGSRSLAAIVESDQHTYWIKSERELSPDFSHSLPEYSQGEYEKSGDSSGGPTQFTPSVDSYAYKTEDGSVEY